MYHFKKLDTLRFFAFLLVFWEHGISHSFIGVINESFRRTGGIGVHIFFVLSGFLITFLLIKEHDVFGRISIKHFYLRRVLRIWPLYYLVLILGIFILPNLTSTFKFDGSVFKNLFFLNNFDMGSEQPNIAIAWSVAIEEQFYLFWPILFSLFYKRNLLNFICLILFCFSSFYIFTHPLNAYFHTFGNINYLMAGCFGASIYTKYQKYISLSVFTRKKAIYGIIALFLIIKVMSSIYIPVNFIALLLPLNYLWLVIYLVDSNNTSKTTFFSKMGKYTYGMYFYHATFLIVVKIIFDIFILDYKGNVVINSIMALTALAVTILSSVLSYNYFERHILRLKNKISPIKTRI